MRPPMQIRDRPTLIHETGQHACHLLTSREWSETEIPSLILLLGFHLFLPFLGPCLLLPKSCWAIPVWQGEEDPLLGLLMSNDCTGLLYGTRRKEEGFFFAFLRNGFLSGPREGCNIGMFKKEYLPRLRAKFRRVRKKGLLKTVFLSPMGRDTQHLFFGAHNLLLLLLHPRFPPSLKNL